MEGHYLKKSQSYDRLVIKEFETSTQNMTTILAKRSKILESFIDIVKDEVFLRKVQISSYEDLLNKNLCGVDGSNNEAESLGIFISFVSGAGIILNGFNDSKPTRIIHGYPKELQISEMASIEDLISIKRDIIEVKIALEILEQLDSNSGYLFLDGPILPPDNYIRFVPSTLEEIERMDDIYLDSFIELIGFKEEKIGLISELIEKSRRKNIPLIGIVKRPRSIYYIGRIIGRDVAIDYNIHDGIILDSIIFNAQENTGGHVATELVPIEQRLIFNYLAGVKSGDILYNYISPAQGSPPIRVEIPSWVDIKNRVEEVLSVTILSSSNTIGIPLPILLAHMTCKIPDDLKNLLWRELEFCAAKLGTQGLELVKKYHGRSP